MKIRKVRFTTLLIALSLTVTGCQTKQEPATSEAFSSKDIIYFVLTDRFKDGSLENNNFPDVDKNAPQAYHGGDFAGLTQSLDYIKSLGTTAIWVTPILKNQPKGYHGYWTIDFEQIDPHLGTEAEFKTFVDEAHKRGMKVLLDYIVNHTGEETPWLNEPDKADWFHKRQNISNWADLKEVENNWLFGLPDLNTENPEVATYLTNNAKDWIRRTGIDGMRLDTVRHVPRPFWKSFTESVKAEFPNFYFIGEVWNDNTRYMQLYNDEGIDGLTNYSLYKGITGTFTKTGSSSSMVSALEKEKFFKQPKLNGIFIDNHDNPRYVTVNGKSYTKQALAFIMTYPAIPIIYYGTELGMEGKGDPDNRRDMTWDKVSNNAMLDYYQALLKLRQSETAITTGTVKAYKTSKDVLAYEVTKDGKGILVLMNLRNKPVKETIPLSGEFALKGSANPLLSEGDGKILIESTQLTLELSPNQIAIYQIHH